MLKSLIDWLDHRTGAKGLVHEALYEKIPGGSRWRYVWGSTLTFALMVQFITGIFLWMAYTPSAQTAWESVFYIQFEMSGGWFLRGIHHFMAQAMNVLLVLHLMQVVIDGAYRAPREVNFWFGLGLLGLTMALSLTGYLLPWDQKGYWATKVATNIAAITPVIGNSLQTLIIGGSDYGHHTLSRFFALHAGVLPAAIVALVVGHIYLFRRHGITPKLPKRRPDALFWPDQVLKDAVACLAVLAAVLFLTIRNRGAELYAPADPSEPFSAARPEWYFLFLFQLLKYFPGGTEVWGAIVLPGVVAAAIGLMPMIGRTASGHRANLVMLCGLLMGAGALTALALRDDAGDPSYQVALKQAKHDAERVVSLARSPTGIPPTGAVTLLRGDPKTQGPRLFSKHCASCHRFNGHDGLGGQVADAASAPDLGKFGSREWLVGFLDPARVDSMEYFGGTKHKTGKMVRFVKQKVSKYSPEQRQSLDKVIAALSAEAGLKSQRELDARDAAKILEGRTLLSTELNCTDCHQFRKPDEDATAPDLTGWGSREWLIGIIGDPAHPRFYGDRNDRMPRFKESGIMDAESIAHLVDWLRGEWYEEKLP